MTAIPVIALTGHLGAGKTTLLNHLLQNPAARIGLVINDFGEINVDANLVSGQIDEPASIAGGCICCLPDEGGLDVALAKLAEPRLRLDAILVEASGLADPVAMARIIGFSGVPGLRPGGVIDVIDAANHFHTIDRGTVPPARYGAASLVVVNKLDQIPEADRAATMQRIEHRVRERNPDAHIVGVSGGRIDPALLYDAAGAGDKSGQLSFRDLLFDTPEYADGHIHADSVTVTGAGCIDPDALADLLENPPADVYRLKGIVAVRRPRSIRTYVVNVVGTTGHLGAAPAPAARNFLVAIGMHLDTDEVRRRLTTTLREHGGPASADGLRRLARYHRPNF